MDELIIFMIFVILIISIYLYVFNDKNEDEQFEINRVNNQRPSGLIKSDITNGQKNPERKNKKNRRVHFNKHRYQRYIDENNNFHDSKGGIDNSKEWWISESKKI